MHKWYSCANLGSEIEYTQSQRWWYNSNRSCDSVTAIDMIPFKPLSKANLLEIYFLFVESYEN